MKSRDEEIEITFSNVIRWMHCFTFIISFGESSLRVLVLAFRFFRRGLFGLERGEFRVVGRDFFYRFLCVNGNVNGDVNSSLFFELFGVIFWVIELKRKCWRVLDFEVYWVLVVMLIQLSFV